MSDALADGRRFRVLCVIDDFTWESLALAADSSPAGERVVRKLDAIVVRRSKPQAVANDKDTELVSNAIAKWRELNKLDWPPSLRAS